MCTRFQLTAEHYRQVLRELGIDAPASFLSRYNIAPSTAIPAVRNGSHPPHRESVALRWGLTPAWAKSDEPASRLVNARAETLAAKPSFRDALRTRRCAIPASGFYEWQTVGHAKKPWLFRRHDAQPFGLAGLWEAWRAPDGAIVESCAVITTPPNDLMRPIHHRMPVMLPPAQLAMWLDPRITDAAALSPLLLPAPAETMTAIAVSSYVSNVRNEGLECLAPAVSEPTGDAGPQLSLGL